MSKEKKDPKNKPIRRWTWIAIDRASKRVLAFVTGNRKPETLQKLLDKLKHVEIKHFYTDGLEAYKQLIPAEKLTQTYTVESFNGVIRERLSRFVRKTKSFSKCEKMLDYSLNLLFMQHNKQIDIFA